MSMSWPIFIFMQHEQESEREFEKGLECEHDNF
jgi:hypothetical protein